MYPSRFSHNPQEKTEKKKSGPCLSKPVEIEAGADPQPGCSRDVNSVGGGSLPHHHQPSLPALDRATHRSTHTDQAASSIPGHYATDLCNSPIASSSSDESMNNHGDGDDITPPESLVKAESLHAGAATEKIGRLSLDHDMVKGASPPPCRGRDVVTVLPAVVSKRSASSELQRPGGHQAPRCCNGPKARQAPRLLKTRLQRYAPASSAENLRRDSTKVICKDKPRQPVRDDSGYASQHPLQSANARGLANFGMGLEGMVQQQSPIHSRYPGLMMQPHSSPISKEQLAAEVKGIYAGLVMVEAKCTSMDAAQAEDTKSVLEPEQWQALIALHRTLLYEHHDFLMATQHLSATPALRCLPAKYNMPARMWKHGIHAFLEVLRHRRPHAQQYMLAFIYLAYQMMALLYETVPSFTDTWIECLGDLARYRMAIEEEKEAHATWGGVAARWYNMASDRHPAIGRLYHHLGILERPSLRKFCFYVKALTCVIPFQNARDSLSTLCTPIIQDEGTVQSSRQSAEARIVTYHALSYAKADQETIAKVGNDALRLIQLQSSRLRDFGSYLAVTNISALFNLGDPLNSLWQLYMTAITLSVQSGRTSALPTPALALPSCGSLAFSTRFWSSTFALIVRRPLKGDGECSLRDCLPYIHVMLVWLHSLSSLEARLSCKPGYSYALPVDIASLAWDGLASFLNALAGQEGLSAKVLDSARRGIFSPSLPDHPKKAMPLAEDYLIRGLIWGQFFFCPGWFEGQGEDDGRSIETAEKAKARGERVLLLGLYFALHTSYLSFDASTRKFSADRHAMVKPVDTKATAAVNDPAVVYAAADAVDPAPESETERSTSETERSTSDPSSGSGSDEGFAIVKRPRAEDVKVFMATSREKRSVRVG